MNISKLNDGDIGELSRMAASRLMESTEASYQFAGMVDTFEFLCVLNDAQIRYWQRTGEVWVVDKDKGMLAGHYKNDVNTIGFLWATLKVNLKALKAASKADRAQFMRNTKATTGTWDVKWRKQVCGKLNYYYIDLIVIDPLLMGSGALRGLLDPVLNRAREEKIPVLLDTHDEANVPIYQHFGFEVVCRHAATHNAMVQYSMVKWPAPA